MDYIANIFGLRSGKELTPNHFMGRNKYSADAALKGLEIKVNHMTYRRKYKVKELSDKPANQITIDYEEKDGNGNPMPTRKMTLVEFFVVAYGKTLTFPSFPVCCF